MSVALVLTHAVLPKEMWLADRQLEIEWPVSGIPEYLHVDNGPEFESAALIRGAEEHGMALVHRPVRQRRAWPHSSLPRLYCHPA